MTVREERWNLITDSVEVVEQPQLQYEAIQTALCKQALGDCDGVCEWTEPYGWVPECGCPVHDPD